MNMNKLTLLVYTTHLCRDEVYYLYSTTCSGNMSQFWFAHFVLDILTVNNC